MRALRQVLGLDRDSFNRLCGSLFDVLSRNMGTYEEMMASMADAKAKQASPPGSAAALRRLGHFATAAARAVT